MTSSIGLRFGAVRVNAKDFKTVYEDRMKAAGDPFYPLQDDTGVMISSYAYKPRTSNGEEVEITPRVKSNTLDLAIIEGLHKKGIKAWLA